MPNKKVNDFLYERESYLVRGACFEVWKALGGVFKEKAIERALAKEFKLRGLNVETQKRIGICYKEEFVGNYTPDFIVEDKIIVELKSKSFITREDKKQFWDYLKGTKYRLGFLINFGPRKVEIIRRAYDTARDRHTQQKHVSASVPRPIQRFNQRSVQHDSAGLTLIELLIVIGIIAIVGATIIPVASGFLVRNYLKNKTNEVVSSLRTAQINSLNGKEDRQWGVVISASSIKMYAVGDAAFDQTFSIPSSISITQDTIVFDKLTGNPDATAAITVSSNAGQSNTIIVNEVGTVNVQ